MHLILPILIAVVPEAFGAVANDGADDRVAMQAAVDDACVRRLPVALEPGAVYELSEDPWPGAARMSSLRFDCPGGTVLIGNGARLVMRGAPQQSDWRFLEARAPVEVVGPLFLDGSQREGTGEQTHLFHATGTPTSRVVVRGVTFFLPERGPQSGGDCIRIAGASSLLTAGEVIVDGNVAIDCDRSFVAFQYGARRVVITGNVVLHVGDQEIDGEVSTAGGTGSAGEIVVADNLFSSAGASGESSIGLGASGPMDRITITGNIASRGVILYNVSATTVVGNVLGGPVLLRKAIAAVTVASNVIDNAFAHPAINIEHQGTGHAVGVSVMGNHVTQRAGKAIVDIQSAGRVSLVGNVLHYAGVVTAPAVALHGVIAPIRVLASLNWASGPVSRFVHVRGDVAILSVTGNVSEEGGGVRFDEAVVGRCTIASNDFIGLDVVGGTCED